MDIKIVVDSMVDLPKSIITDYGIEVVPLQVIFGKEEYWDGVDLSYEEFYQKLSEAKDLPTTAQVTPAAFTEVFQRFLDEGKEIICINGSSKASGTYQAANIAMNEIASDRIVAIDTLSLSLGAGILVYEAAKMVADGKAKGEVVEQIKKLQPRADHIFTVDTLDYLKRGGRLNPMKATVANMFNIKPILTVVDGLVEPLDKVRGSKKVIKKMIEIAKTRGVDFSEKVVGLAHANNPKGLEILIERVREELNPMEIITSDIGCTIGTHAGPGTLAIFYLWEN